MDLQNSSKTFQRICFFSYYNDNQCVRVWQVLTVTGSDEKSPQRTKKKQQQQNCGYYIIFDYYWWWFTQLFFNLCSNRSHTLSCSMPNPVSTGRSSHVENSRTCPNTVLLQWGSTPSNPHISFHTKNTPLCGPLRKNILDDPNTDELQSALPGSIRAFQPKTSWPLQESF